MPDASMSTERRRTLNAIANALGQEADYLTTHPIDVWQQLFNRIQWESASIPLFLTPELQRRTAPDTTPWLWLRSHSAESSALVRTLRGFGGSPLAAFAAHPEKHLIVVCDTSASARVWDSVSGQLLASYRLPQPIYEVTACAVNAEGNRLVVTTGRGAAVVTDIHTGHRLVVLNPGTSDFGREIPYWACTFSPDDRLIATGGSGGVQIWDATTGVRRDDLRVPVPFRCEGLAFSPDNSCLLVTGEGPLSLWKLGAPTPVWTAEATRYFGSSRTILRCVFSRDGTRIVTAGRDWASSSDKLFFIHRHALRLWDAETGQEIALADDLSGAMLACAISPDGKVAVAGGEGAHVSLWDTTMGKRIATLDGHTESVFGCAFSQTGEFVFTAGSDNVRIWNVEQARNWPTYGEQQRAGKALTVAWSPDGKLALSTDSNDIAKLWEPPKANENTAFEHSYNLYARNYTQSCEFHPSMSRIAVVTETNGVEVRLTGGGSVQGRINGPKRVERLCDWSPDGRLLITADDTDVHLWDVETLTLRATLLGSSDHKVNVFAMSPNGAHLVVASEHIPILWTLGDNPTSETFTGDDYISKMYELSFLPDGATIVSTSDRAIYLWDVATMRQREGIELPYMHMSDYFERPPWAISPDGTLIAASGQPIRTAHGLQPPVSVWETQTGRLAVNLFGHENVVSACAFSPDGLLVLSGGKDRAVKIWDVASRTEIMAIPLPDIPLSAAFHPWRPRILVGGSSGHVHYMELEGVSYGPLIVTAIDRGAGLAIRCPACGHTFALAPAQIGVTVACPQPDCRIQLRTNPFVTTMASAADYAMPRDDSPLERPTRRGDGSPSDDRGSTLAFERERRNRPFWRFWRRS